MKSINKKKTIKVIEKFFLSVFAIVLLFALPLLGLKTDDNLARIYSTFLGSKSKYQGIIEIWNIDTFESGTASKSSFLSSSAKSFQNKNKGLYIMVRNLSETECINLLMQGERPDLFSCSYGVSEKLRDYILPFNNQTGNNVASNFLSAGKINNEQMAIAWCRGCYVLLSTKEKLESAEKAGALKQFIDNNAETSAVDQVMNGNIKLSDIALGIGYKIEGKKSTKIVYSLTYGANKYLLPQIAFESYTNKGLVSISDVDIDKSAIAESQYFAYSNFIAGKSSILLGSQRDIARVNNRVEMSKMSDVIFEPLYGSLDIVQYMLLAKSENSLRREYAEKFTEFITTETEQQKLSNIGMFSVSNIVNCGYTSGIMLDIASENINVYKPKQLFN